MKTSIDTIEDFITELQKDAPFVRGKIVRTNVEREGEKGSPQVVYFRAGYIREDDEYLEHVELLMVSGKDMDVENKDGTKAAGELEDQLAEAAGYEIKLRRGRIDLNG